MAGRCALSAIVSLFGRTLGSPFRRGKPLVPESRGATWIRVAVSLLAGVLLTAFIYLQGVYLIFTGGFFQANGMLYLLRILWEPRLVWALALLASATAAIALHLLGLLLWPGARHRRESGARFLLLHELPGQDRLATARDLTALGCFAVLNALVVYRLSSLIYFFHLRLLPLPPAFAGIAGSAELSSWTVQPASRLLLAGTLALAAAAMQAWRLLPRLGGRRAEPFVVLSLTLAAGLAAPASSPWKGTLERAPSVTGDTLLQRIVSRIPLPDPKAVRQLDRYQGTGLGVASHHLPLAGSWYSMIRPVLKSGRPGAGPNDAAGGPAVLARDPCELPVLDVFLWRGLEIDLDRSGPISSKPSAIVELPRGDAAARLYDASDLKLTEARSMNRIEDWDPAGDWVILKADPNVDARKIYRLLTALGHSGVRRLTLAAVPGRLAIESFENRNRDAPLLLLDDGDRALPTLRELLVAAEFPTDCCRLLCAGYGDLYPYCEPEEYLNLHIYSGLPPAQRFPRLIRLDLDPLAPGEVMFYQQLVSMIEVATLHGGRELHLEPPGRVAPESPRNANW